mgnify:CR=1 FL=1
MTNPIRGNSRHAMVLDGVGFDVSGTVILKPLTLAVLNRGITGLVGQNGSGKSTLLRILARQQPPSRGSIAFEGRPLQAWPEREFARKVAYLPQHTPLAAGLTVRELVELGRYPWHGALGRFSHTDREKVDEALALTSTDMFADRFVDTLSGGERFLASLALALALSDIASGSAGRLDCLFLDEGFSSLDGEALEGAIAAVERMADHGRLVAVITHLPGVAERLGAAIHVSKDPSGASHVVDRAELLV